MSAIPSPPPLRYRLERWAQDELQPPHLFSSLNAAVILFLLQVVLTSSIAALIFSGSLTAQLPSAISFILIGDAFIVAIVSLLSSYPGAIAVSQDKPGIILAVAVATVAGALPADSTRLFPTVMALIVGSTLAMGVLSLALGMFKLGGLVRFIPFPVMGGFLAGSGWLLVAGGIRVAANVPFGADLLHTETAIRWVPALILGGAMFVIVSRTRKPRTLFGLFALALAAFYGVALLLGVPIALLAADGWLLGPFPREVGWHPPLDPQTLAAVDWSALLAALPVALSALFISLTALLLNASSLELVVRQDIDLNRELIAAGAANVAASAAGGVMGYHTISMSAVSHSFGHNRRLPGLLVAVLMIVTILLGASLLSYIPRLLLGGLLIYIGIGLLWEWVVRAWFTFPKIDYAIVISILVVIALKDFLWGLALGLILTALLFIVNYSRISSIRYELTGAISRSRVSRGPQHSQFLQAHGDEVLIFKLQGFIFFGTAYQIFERVRERAHAVSTAPRTILLDFEQVSGLDSTALLSFQKLLQFTREHHITLILAGLVGRARDQLLKGGFSDDTVGVRLFVDTDHAMEWVEEEMLARHQTELPAAPSLVDQLAVVLPERDHLAQLIGHMTRREVAAGEYLIRQDDEPDELYLIESGQFTAQLEPPGRRPLRLEAVRGGRMVGELGFFLGTRRNASVVADRDGVVYSLNQAQWAQLKHDHPEVAQTLSDLTIHLLGQRVLHQTRVVQALQG